MLKNSIGFSVRVSSGNAIMRKTENLLVRYWESSGNIYKNCCNLLRTHLQEISKIRNTGKRLCSQRRSLKN